MEAAIELGRSTVGLTLVEMKDLVPGKLYSPTRPVTMKKGSASSSNSNGDQYNPSTNITPDQALQFIGTHKEDNTDYLEFLGADQIYTMTTDVAFVELEPLYFVRQERGTYEMKREFCLFDTFGIDKVIEELMKFDNVPSESEQAAKELYTNTIKSVLDPLIEKNLMVEYKVLDGGDKTLIVQAKTSSRGTYCRLELGL